MILDTYRLRQLEAVQFIRRVLTELRTNWKAQLSSDPLLNIHVSRLDAVLLNLDSGMVKAVINDLTERISKLDRIRDIGVSSLRRACRLALDSEDEEEVEAAKSLMNLWKKYKGLEKMTYEAETFAIDQLLEDLAREKYAAHIALLGLERYVNRLKISAKAFNDLFSTRSQEVAAKEVFDLKVLRKAAFEVYEGMTAYVEVMLDTLPTPILEEAFMIINSIRKSYSDTLAIRIGKAEAAKASNHVQKEPDEVH